MKTKKILKIVMGVIIFFTLPSLLFFGFVYFKYNEDLPAGQQGPQADALAHKMLQALNHEAYLETNYIEWTFKNRHHYQWQKNENTCMVHWKDYKVDLNLNNPSLSKAFVHNFEVQGEQASEYIATALGYFNNDSFQNFRSRNGKTLGKLEQSRSVIGDVHHRRHHTWRFVFMAFRRK